MYSHAEDILHLTASLSRVLEGRLQSPGSCVRFTLHLICLYVLASFTSLILAVTPVTLPCTPPSCLPPECHQLFHHLPPLWSVSLPQDLSSDCDGMFQGYILPGANEKLNQFMEPTPNAPSPRAPLLSDPFISTPPPPPPPQHPAVVHLFSDTESFLFPCL